MQKYISKQFALTVDNETPEEYTSELFSRYIAPLTSYISKPQKFLEILTYYKNQEEGELILRDFSISEEYSVVSRVCTLEQPLNSINAPFRNVFPRKEFRLEVPVDGNVERLLAANEIFPYKEKIRKGYEFEKKNCVFRIFRELVPKEFEVNDEIVYTGAEHPANAPEKHFGNNKFCETVFGLYDKEIFGYIDEDFVSKEEIELLIEAVGEDEHESAVMIAEMEAAVGGGVAAEE